MSNLPLVSVVVPCRNEEKYIAGCLDSIIANDYPKEKLEILVVDGLSQDKTKDIVCEYAKKHTFINIFDNYKKTTPCAFNTGIKATKGEAIMIVGAHSMCGKDYISKCVSYLTNSDASNVGGIFKVLPENNSLIAKSIAFALTSPFSCGNAYYKVGSKEPRYVDTVWGGCYKKEVFEKIGYFDEDLLRNSDDEFNLRLIKNGGKILLVPEIATYHYARGSLKKLWSMYFQYGYFKPLAALKLNAVLTWRQLVPAIFVLGLLGSFFLGIFSRFFGYIFIFTLGLYIIANFVFALRIALKNGIRQIFVLPFTFVVLHFSYGFGYLKGIWDFAFFKKYKNKSIVDLALTR